jgi:hypothetical protein
VDSESGGLLARAATRAEREPFFLASALAAYRALSGLDDAALAAELGCAESALARLALCRRPRGDSPMFREDVTRIAAATGADAARLARLLRAADAAETLRAAPSAGLLAAQDRGISEMRAPYDAVPESGPAAAPGSGPDTDAPTPEEPHP